MNALDTPLPRASVPSSGCTTSRRREHGQVWGGVEHLSGGRALMRPPRAEAARLTAACALTTIAIGLLVLAGWAIDIDALQRLFVGEIHMLPLTAAAFVISGVSLWMQLEHKRGTVWLIARSLALVVLAIGAITLIERITGWDGPIDRLLFPDQLERLSYRPIGRMASNSAIGFSFAGAALFLLDGQTRLVRQIAHWFSTLGIAIAALAMIGYLYGVQALYQMDASAAMPVATALAPYALHAGILRPPPHAAWAGRLVVRTGTGMLARRLLLALTIVPLALGWLYINAREEMVVSRAAGVAILVVAMIAIQLTVLLRAAAIVQRGERAQALALENAAAARDEAERANRAKNDFLAVMSHELRTPLNAIIGYGSLLRDGIPDPPTPGQHKQIERIGASAKHLLALIDEVLTLSRLELGRERITPSSIGVAILVEQTAAMMEPEARKKGLTISLAVPEQDVVMVTDAGKLRQALLNLLSNAVKFTDHGRVSIRASCEGEVDQVVFEVEDTGIGIS